MIHLIDFLHKFKTFITQPWVSVHLPPITLGQWNMSDTLTDKNDKYVDKQFLFTSGTFFRSLSSQSQREQHNRTTPAIVCQFACSNRLPFLNIGMRAILWCWKGLSSPLHVVRASLVAWNAMHCASEQHVQRLSWAWRQTMSFEFVCDYLQRGRAPDAQFGQRSGRGWWGGCRPGRCQ